MLLKLDEITLIEGNHARSKINQKQVSHYAALMKDGAVFPPVVVFGEENILADGWHRYYATRQNKGKEIMAERKPGGAREARLYSYEANNHGLPPTPKERIDNATFMLQDQEWSEWADAKIARHCGLDRTTVWRLRKSVAKQQISPPPKPIKSPTLKESSETPKETPTEAPKTFSTPITEIDEAEFQEMAETVSELQKEVTMLRDIIASKRWDASEIEQEDILDTVKELRTQIEILEEENRTLRISRDTHQERCAELIRINKSLQKKKAA
jgi:hypothetical protein